LPFIRTEKNNLANTLTKLALNLTTHNNQRHQVIQDFFLTNDSTTIATEVPVYLTKDDLIYFLSKGFSLNPLEYKTPITGHIDLLQIRNGLIHILDYKPEANKQNPIHQLTIYALALASRTKLAIKDFKCAWFDNQHYYEFFPLSIVHKLKKGKRMPREQVRLKDEN
jgi:ATP-dependent exoDNAse (exonuclease V) beta subunit